MGSGKSSIGRRIAAKLGYRFADTDRLIVQNVGSEISEIFEEKGERFFRAEETRSLASLRGRTGLVIATGGGIVTQRRNILQLKKIGFVVWLMADEEVIFTRVARN